VVRGIDPAERVNQASDVGSDAEVPHPAPVDDDVQRHDWKVGGPEKA